MRYLEKSSDDHSLFKSGTDVSGVSVPDFVLELVFSSTAPCNNAL